MLYKVVLFGVGDVADVKLVEATGRREALNKYLRKANLGRGRFNFKIINEEDKSFYYIAEITTVPGIQTKYVRYRTANKFFKPTDGGE